jgi:4-amino-4-deoxy-L-arabinose transferase-like glycosyltransferase
MMCVIVVVGFLLRAALPGRMAVEHFDEGVYASNLYSGDQDPPHAYPDRHLYAPPCFPALLEWAILLSGGRAQAAMWVNVLAGALTTLVVWWGARQCFRPAVGIISATLAATSDYHIAFSRMALTDVPLCLWMAGGVFAGWRAVFTGRPVWMIAAAVFSALGWWTKYNGWLTLAVTGSGTVAWLLFDRHRTVSAGQALRRWTAVAAVAVLLWWPFLGTIPAGSSYADISANHAKYFVGPSGWWQSLRWQVETQRYLDGWCTVTGMALAVCAAAWVNCERFTWNGNLAAGVSRMWMRPMAVGLGIGVAAIACGSTIVLGVVAIAGVARIAVKRAVGMRPTPEEEGPNAPCHELTLAAWMVAAWFIGLLAATPFYHPYPRLALPWLLSCWLAAGAVLGAFLERMISAVPAGPMARRECELVTATAVVALLLAFPLAVWRGPPLVPPRWTAWQDRTELQEVAAGILRDAAQTARELGPSGHSQIDAVFYVYGEPALFFQLEKLFHLEARRTAGLPRYVSSPATSLALRDPVEVAVFLVTGPHAHRAGAGADPAVQGYRLVAAYPYRPSDVVQLDEYPAARLFEDRGLPDEEIRLYLVHGPLRRR